MSKDPIDISQRTNAPTIMDVLGERVSRRSVLKGSVGVASASLLPGFLLVGCDNNDNGSTSGSVSGRPGGLNFSAVPKNTTNNVSLPAGYSARVLYAKGDPINNSVAAYQNNGTDVDFDQRAGDEHDGMYYFGLSGGQWAPAVSASGLLCMNHENLEDTELHANGPTAAANNGGSRPESEVRKEMNAHGISVIQVDDSGSGFNVNRGSGFNRRITAFTEMDIRGPLRGNAKLSTPFSNDGTAVRGTLNNCANGFTPWGTYLTCEENWFSYWNRGDDAANRSTSDNALFSAYGMGPDSRGFSYREWDTVAGDVYERFNITAQAGGNALSDYRNEPNNFGYIVEIDPFDPNSRPQKRTALGRFVHEGCWVGPVNAGEPLVFYMGDDARNEYIYKFVSDAVWDPADVNGGLAVGNKYLDEGTLYVARFNADGSGDWLEINFGPGMNGTLASGYEVNSTADALVGARLVADALGATPMDRPEWGAVDPLTGEVYMTLTNSSSSSSGRGQGGAGSLDTDPANPRAYTDETSTTTGRQGNVNGHIIRWREAAGNASTTFTWDIFLFGAEAAADPDNINISGLTDDNDFSSPDGLYFDQRGLLWIQTDDSAIRDLTNDQLLASLPGSVGDGNSQDVTSSLTGNTVTTHVGQQASGDNLRRFLVGPVGCEITGITITPDYRSLFINVQHPSSPTLDGGDSWPHTSGDATLVGNGARGRSATIVITRDDGGPIAL